MVVQASPYMSRFRLCIDGTRWGSFNKEVVLPHGQAHTQQVAMSSLQDAARGQDLFTFLPKKGCSLLRGLPAQYNLGQGHPAVFASDKNTGSTFVFLTSLFPFNSYIRRSYSHPSCVQNPTFSCVYLVFLTIWQHTLIVHTWLQDMTL